jgi:hypothetical protein
LSCRRVYDAICKATRQDHADNSEIRAHVENDSINSRQLREKSAFLVVYEVIASMIFAKPAQSRYLDAGRDRANSAAAVSQLVQIVFYKLHA